MIIVFASIMCLPVNLELRLPNLSTAWIVNSRFVYNYFYHYVEYSDYIHIICLLNKNPPKSEILGMVKKSYPQCLSQVSAHDGWSWFEVCVQYNLKVHSVYE